MTILALAAALADASDAPTFTRAFAPPYQCPWVIPGAMPLVTFAWRTRGREKMATPSRALSRMCGYPRLNRILFRPPDRLAPNPIDSAFCDGRAHLRENLLQQGQRAHGHLRTLLAV